MANARKSYIGPRKKERYISYAIFLFDPNLPISLYLIDPHYILSIDLPVDGGLLCRYQRVKISLLRAAHVLYKDLH